MDMAAWSHAHLYVVNGGDVMITMGSGSTILVQDAAINLVEHSIFLT